MDLDFAEFYRRLERVIQQSTDFGSSVSAMMKWGDSQIPHPSWSELGSFDAEDEIRHARQWMPRALNRAPCPFPVRGAFFGLSEFQDATGADYADLYFGLMGDYHPADIQARWLHRGPRYYPENCYLRSSALKRGGMICQSGDPDFVLGAPGHIVFSLSFAALLLRHVLDGAVFALLHGTREIGLACGFDSGDLLRLGELTETGFVPFGNEAE